MGPKRATNTSCSTHSQKQNKKSRRKKEEEEETEKMRRQFKLLKQPIGMRQKKKLSNIFYFHSSYWIWMFLSVSIGLAWFVRRACVGQQQWWPIITNIYFVKCVVCTAIFIIFLYVVVIAWMCWSFSYTLLAAHSKWFWFRVFCESSLSTWWSARIFTAQSTQSHPVMTFQL